MLQTTLPSTLTDPDLQTLVGRFLAAKAASLGPRGGRALRIYGRDLSRLVAAFGARAAGAIAPHELELHLQGLGKLDGRPYSAGTRGRLRASLATFFAWACATGELAANPMAHVATCRRPQRTPQGPSQAVETELLARAAAKGTREAALVALALGTGLRVGQLLALDHGDVLLDGRLLRVAGNPARLVYVPPGARSVLARHLTHVPPTTPLWRTSRGRLSYPHAISLLGNLGAGLAAEDGSRPTFAHLRALALSRWSAAPSLLATPDGRHNAPEVLERFLLAVLAADDEGSARSI